MAQLVNKELWEGRWTDLGGPRRLCHNVSVHGCLCVLVRGVNSMMLIVVSTNSMALCCIMNIVFIMNCLFGQVVAIGAASKGP
jgi:hypothetical protein